MRTAACVLLWFLAMPLMATPSFDEARESWRPSEARLLDRHGAVLHELRVDMRVRRLSWTPLGEISPALIQTLIAAEDKRFYAHHGVDWTALVGAMRDLLWRGRLRGASTLSMQLAAMLDVNLRNSHGRRSLTSKISQMRAALLLERTWTKQQILEAYVNLAYFRGELQGIAVTAEVLFGKQPSGLNAREAALLVALLPAPTTPARGVAARACAIAKMDDCRDLLSLATRIFGRAQSRPAAIALAPHLAHRLLNTPGSEVRTTLDAELQQLAIEALHAQLLSLRDRNVRDGAAIVVENASGAVLAYVAAAGPYSTARQVDGIRAQRQAGSTLKPFLYGLALERGYLTAASVLMDTPVNLETQTGLYIPQNYDRDFKGPVSVRTALAGSLNVPAVRTLVLTGVEDFRDHLREVGYGGITEDGEYYGYSLALGSAEVSLLEQVTAYRTLARGGLHGPLHYVEPATPIDDRRVMRADAAFIISDILSDPAGRAITFGLGSPLSTRYWSAVKTGTSKDMRDNWCIGYTDRYTVGVWVGNFEGDSMHDVSGVTGAAPVWLEIMNALHSGAPAPAPLPPAGVIANDLDFAPAIEPPRREWFIDGTETTHITLTEPMSDIVRIASPPNGVIIALDPDIPERHQFVPLQARSAKPGSKLILDETVMGTATAGHLWQPQAGLHTLKLVDIDGKELDRVRFTVRPPY